MPELSAIRDDEASPYESLARAKAILRNSAERALLEKRRKEKQRGLQRSMLEYTEHARRVRQAHLELQAKGGGFREPTAADRLGAALSYKPRKGRSPLRASDNELRRLYGTLTQADKKALEDRYLPEILKSGTGSNLTGSTESRTGNQRGEGTDFWDIVQKDGTVKRVVILRTDDQFVHLRECKTKRHTDIDRDVPLKVSERKSGGFVSYRSDGTTSKRLEEGRPTNSVTNSEKPQKLTSVFISEDVKSGTGRGSYHPGILPKPRPEVPDVPVEVRTNIPKPKVMIQVSLPRMELDTPSPEPPDSGDEQEVEKEDDPFHEKMICLKHGFQSCKRCVNTSSDVSSTETGVYHHQNNVSEPATELRISTHTYPIEQPRLPKGTENVESQKPVDRQEGSTVSVSEVSQSSLVLGSDLAYHRGFTVNTSVQSLPSRMDGILRNAMSSAQQLGMGHGGVVSKGPPRGAEPAALPASTRHGLTCCRHGQVASSCNTCRTVEEIQRRLKTNDFRREMRQSFHWDLQAGTALSKSSHWTGQRGKSNLVPHLREMWARKKQTRTVHRGKSTAKKQAVKPDVGLDSQVRRSCASSILKESTDSLGQKKSVRFSEDDIYHPMMGYHPSARDTGNVVSAL
ncbi:uncharacterized protein LOC119718750 [Patiria miniata]|uniref:Uncharacterized protein n=1 Tax=Patiria miniata TaxID=46514 RepID=A0A913YXI7_PATMI|nr:uncharacterized protein LOC119718750 [Patiria miniata]